MEFIVTQTMDELGRIRLPEAHRRFLFIKQDTQIDILPMKEQKQLHLIWPEDQENYNFSGFDRKVDLDWKVSLPRDLRHILELGFDDMLYTYMVSGKIIVSKTLPKIPAAHCSFCLSDENLKPTPVVYIASKPAQREQYLPQCPYCMNHTVNKLIAGREKYLASEPEKIADTYCNLSFPNLSIKTTDTQ